MASFLVFERDSNGAVDWYVLTTEKAPERIQLEGMIGPAFVRDAKEGALAIRRTYDPDGVDRLIIRVGEVWG